jgi:hypothetical protein
MIDEGQAKFSLSKQRKTQLNSPLQVITLNKMQPGSLTCPVETLKDYLAISDQFRSGAKSKLLLLGLRPPRNAVFASTVSRWIKMVLSDAGVDTVVYSAHSTRGASASKATNLGVSSEAILLAG